MFLRLNFCVHFTCVKISSKSGFLSLRDSLVSTYISYSMINLDKKTDLIEQF